ncbi:MAG: pyridoxamine 5'-phosphate oxidase family protein [Eubacteriales bacterium]|nr:pyridoxamine 5'-phosphate oxidase family protein [Eubacteriales bacterium]MDD3199756.1 pyridoxamine 5'-phosphate oxidase family protein [Eubacteriales bacterium]MDD4121932.1 pyridoxamine 5'-phosphate oxidase family protein [Eubacteriales bacterium]MDD4629996.1 pyridoxamine 5'-phosphate oxidase family protein [Eubacteriales bacterium]
MFKEMRRKDKMLTEDEMLDILASSEYGVLSTIGDDGFPYGVPVNYVYKDDFIYFHSASTGHKLDNVANNANVSFCVVRDVELIPDDFNTKFKSVIAFGTVSEVAEAEKDAILTLFLDKFSKDFIPSGMDYIKNAGPNARVFAIKVLHMSAKGKK